MRRPILEHCPRLRVRDVKGAIPTGAIDAALDIGEQRVAVIGRLTNLRNGYRHFFLCPMCSKPRAALYSPNVAPYRCRVCAGLIYAKELRIQ